MALALVLQTKLPPGRRPKEGQNLKPRMNERKKSVCFIYECGFYVWGKCLFCEFLPRVFQEREGGQKRPKKGQEGGQNSNKRRLREGQNEDMISLFHI